MNHTLDREYLTPEEERYVTERDAAPSFHTQEAADNPQGWPDDPGATFDPHPGTNPALRAELEADGCSEWPEVPDFEPLSQAEFEALTRRLLHLRAERDAIAANSEAMCAELDRRIERVLADNEPQLRHYIDGGYGRKSARCVYGLLGIRKGGGRTVIVDERLAVESVQELAPSALTVNLKRLPPHFTAPGFDTTPETSKLYVSPLPRNRKAGESDAEDSE